MVATDATCSGLQILAGLARDKSTASLVNVLPGSEPQDAYKVVSKVASPNCPISIQPYMDRKVVKRVVMTVPYNAKPFSNRGYIRDALAEKEVEISKEDLTATVKAVRDAMDVVVPGPMAVMSWIEQEVAAAIKAGKTYLEWTTPSGFVVHQKLNKKDVVRVQLQLLGTCEMQVAVGDTDEVDINHHKNATAPNLIHSLDASLLHLSVPCFDAPIALIHDSVLCRATDMSSLSVIVRETYMHLFAVHDYLNTFARQIGAKTEPPIIGDLKPESVIESTYFFC
jgi:DNA-directed RNA polymerase